MNTVEKASATIHLKSLGEGTTKYSYNMPDPGLLECFPNLMSDYTDNVVEISAPEFTSLCPKTGQPDFATIIICYVPDKECIESKSLKLYLGSFRMYGAFHEQCVAIIHHDLWSLLNPKFLTVQGQFTPRGGIKFWPTVKRQKADL